MKNITNLLSSIVKEPALYGEGFQSSGNLFNRFLAFKFSEANGTPYLGYDSYVNTTLVDFQWGTPIFDPDGPGGILENRINLSRSGCKTLHVCINYELDIPSEKDGSISICPYVNDGTFDGGLTNYRDNVDASTVIADPSKGIRTISFSIDVEKYSDSATKLQVPLKIGLSGRTFGNSYSCEITNIFVTIWGE
jgi:hypothetical protein